MIVLISAIVLVLFIDATLSCGGYELKIDYIRNCGSNNVVELSNNFTVNMKNNCEFQFHGCFTVHQNITKSEVEYTVQKDIIKKSGKKNGCSQLENKSNDIEMGLEILGLPKQCPIYKGTMCFHEKSIDISKYKMGMNVLAGHLSGNALMTTDTGNSCFEFSAKLINTLVSKSLPSIGHMVG